MEIVRFGEEGKFRVKVAQIFQQESERIRKALPSADIQHVGSTAVPGSLTKGDLDIQVRVSGELFPRAAETLEGMYDRNEGSIRNELFAAFKDDNLDPPLGVQLTVMGSEYDFFWRIRDFLLTHEEYRQAYDNLKSRFDGKDMAEYRAAKSAFMEQLMQSDEFRM